MGEWVIEVVINTVSAALLALLPAVFVGTLVLWSRGSARLAGIAALAFWAGAFVGQMVRE